jgi:hypothetical protein
MEKEALRIAPLEISIPESLAIEGPPVEVSFRSAPAPSSNRYCNSSFRSLSSCLSSLNYKISLVF